MAADIDSIAFVVDCTRQTTDVISLFEQNRLYVCVPLQLESRSQSGGTGANDDGSPLFLVIRFVAG